MPNYQQEMHPRREVDLLSKYFSYVEKEVLAIYAVLQ
jgi:hypothetical protein